MNRAIVSTIMPPGGQGEKRNSVKKGDPYGRTGNVQVLHIELFYADGSRGIINVTSPSIVWSEDIETQWYYMRAYLKEQHEKLGIIGYHAHCAGIQDDGTITKVWSWEPFNFLINQETQS